MTTTGRAASNPASTTSNPTEDERKRAASRAPRACAPHAATSPATGRSGVAALAALLRQLRTDHGLSTRRLATRAAVARSTIQRLENGRLRPRPSTLSIIAAAIDPDRRKEIRDQLVAAAGDDLAAHNERWSWYQARRLQVALEAGLVPLPVASERLLRLFTAGDAMWRTSMRLHDLAAAVIDEPGSRFNDFMRLSGALSDESDRLHKEVGMTFGETARPLRRWRGDPADVEPFPPPLNDLRGVWGWLWEWQCREGRLRPRSVRERAILATGERERQKVRDTPEPPWAQPRSAPK